MSGDNLFGDEINGDDLFGEEKNIDDIIIPY